MRVPMLPDHAIATIAVVTAALALQHAPPAAAQRARACATIEADAERLACYDCGALTTDAERLACYDGALGAAAAPPAAPAPILQAPERAPRPAVAAAPPAPAAAPAPTATPAPAAAPARAAAERRATAAGDEAPYPIVVVGLRTRQGKSTFTTDAGQIWVQTDSRAARLPETPFAAEIRPGAMSSWFLVPTAQFGRAIRVRLAQ
jgi:hypothetical protein